MSYGELQPLFPSSTHPALPIAAQILSTLRSITGPGRGNDLKPEERAALVGVSALLGCEQVQSKDLVEKTAQKASSVSPAHFRSALRRARVLIAELPSDASAASPSRRDTRASALASGSRSGRVSGSASASPSRPASGSGSGSAPVARQSLTEEAPSPFQTPKKKFKYSSGVDLSGLRHSPAKGSPLKQSVTPTPLRVLRSDRDGVAVGGSKGAKRAMMAEDEDEDDDDVDADDGEVEEEQLRTPTKARFTPAPPLPMPPSAGKVPGSSTRTRRADVSAFLALRPGSGTSPTKGAASAVTGKRRAVSPDGENEFDRAVRPKRARVEGVRVERRVRRKKDWTFRETTWGGEEVRQGNEKVLRMLGLIEA